MIKFADLGQRILRLQSNAPHWNNKLEMKSILFLLIGIINSECAFAQESGINFYKGSWSDLIRTAENQERMIFVDVHTDWCGPCKYMEKYIFTQTEVEEKYNKSFINYKLDAEKGEGPEMAKRFNMKCVLR